MRCVYSRGELVGVAVQGGRLEGDGEVRVGVQNTDSLAKGIPSAFHVAQNI